MIFLYLSESAILMSSRPAHVAKLAVVGGGAAYATLLVQAKPRKGRLKILNIISKRTNDKQYKKGKQNNIYRIKYQ